MSALMVSGVAIAKEASRLGVEGAGQLFECVALVGRQAGIS